MKSVVVRGLKTCSQVETFWLSVPRRACGSTMVVVGSQEGDDYSNRRRGARERTIVKKERLRVCK